jgi:predicted deacylase
MSNRRIWKYAIAGAALIAIAAVAYTPARQFHRFFLTECAADGPAPETELEIAVEPVDIERFYNSMREAATGMRLEEVGTTQYANRRWPMYLASPTQADSEAPVLVVAGVHGNEVSGSLAGLRLLQVLRNTSPTPPVHVLLPANPVGLAHGSRYNSLGCDINRDFEAFRTDEARAIRAVIARVRPRLVIALHEGPQDGVFVIGTKITPAELLTTIVTELQSRKIPLATENNLGASLATPGLMTEGSFITTAKSWLGIYSLGEHTSSLSIPLITTEIPWSWPSMDERIDAQVTATLVALQKIGSAATPAGASR